MTHERITIWGTTKSTLIGKLKKKVQDFAIKIADGKEKEINYVTVLRRIKMAEN